VRIDRAGGAFRGADTEGSTESQPGMDSPVCRDSVSAPAEASFDAEVKSFVRAHAERARVGRDVV
jgi:hypothetical protein